jgi:hypothetical protein
MAAVLCFLGKVAGWWMGFVSVVLGLTINLYGLVLAASSSKDGPGFKLLQLVFLILLAFLAIVDYRIYRAKVTRAEEETPRPQPEHSNYVEEPPPVDPTAADLTQRRAEATQRPRAAPLRAVARQPLPPAPAADAQIAAAARLLALVTRIEAGVAERRLARAAAMFLPIIGDGAGDTVRAALMFGPPSDDLKNEIRVLAAQVVRNPRLSQIVVRCALHAVRDDDGNVTEAAREATSLLSKALLG